eukprot:11799840-Alexandrium_andersonii.AAC.1
MSLDTCGVCKWGVSVGCSLLDTSGSFRGGVIRGKSGNVSGAVSGVVSGTVSGVFARYVLCQRTV